MDSRSTDRTDDPTVAETPGCSGPLLLGNLHGAKYRDFSASRREYRAQLRHRAAEQRGSANRHCLPRPRPKQPQLPQSPPRVTQRRQPALIRQMTQTPPMRRALREAEEVARTAAAERVEAVCRAEVAPSSRRPPPAAKSARLQKRTPQLRGRLYHVTRIQRCAVRQGATRSMNRQTSPAPSPIPYTIASTPQTPAPSQPVLRPSHSPWNRPNKPLCQTKRVPTLSPSVANILPSRLRWRLQSAASRQATTDPAVRRATTPTTHRESAKSIAVPSIRLKLYTSVVRTDNLTAEGRPRSCFVCWSPGSKADSEAPGPHTTFVFQR